MDWSPNAQPHTCSSSSARVKACPGWRTRNASRSNSRPVSASSGARRRVCAGRPARSPSWVSVGLDAPPAPRAPAQHRPDPERQFAGAERLGDVVVGAELEAEHAVASSPSAVSMTIGTRPRAEPPADLQAVDPGQHQVEDDEVGDGRPRRAGPLAVGGHPHPVARPARGSGARRRARSRRRRPRGPAVGRSSGIPHGGERSRGDRRISRRDGGRHGSVRPRTVRRAHAE